MGRATARGPITFQEEKMDEHTGAALAAMTDRELVRMRQQAAATKPQPKKPEVSDGAVIAALTKAAMPAVKKDARQLQRATAENELLRQRNERAAHATLSRIEQ